MSLVIVVGYDGPGASAKPFPVYMGRVSSEADKALAASNAVRFEIIRNPLVLRKRGRRYAEEQAAAAAAEAETAAATAGIETEAAAEDETAALEAAETTTDTPSEDPDPDSPAPIGISGKRKK